MFNLQRKLFGFKQSSRFFKYLLSACGFLLIATGFINAQDNSPYSRYGLGDIQPSSHIYNRGMGGITAAFSEPPSTGLSDSRNGKSYSNINFSNPASYSRFFAVKELNT